MTTASIYQDIATRTSGDIYIGVVGPVRTGKSTFIKRFMEACVLPNIDNIYRRERARDELPQSGSGRTIMTTEPKFVPEEAVCIRMEDGADVRVRLIDCVGYAVEGATGQMEGEEPRMVMTPWSEQEMTMWEAAEIGTRKVIAEHSTIGIVVTTDGSCTDLPREGYLQAEEQVISELKALQKPFLVLLNSAAPNSESTQLLRRQIAEKYDVTCITENCMEIGEEEVTAILRSVLFEFPLTAMELYLPSWVDALDFEHPIRKRLYDAVLERASGLQRLRDVKGTVEAFAACGEVGSAHLSQLDPGSGLAGVELDLPRSLFYETLSDQSGFSVSGDGDLLGLLSELAVVKQKYDRVAQALEDVETRGYGIVVPGVDSLALEEPEIIRQGGRCGVRLRASAPSIHMIRADVKTELSPIMGSEKQTEEMISSLLQEFEGDSAKIWDSHLFGRSFHELIREDLNTKLLRMPEDAQGKLRETLQRIINEGSGGLICIIL